MNPAWCRQYATSFIPVRGGCFNPNRFECVALSCTAYPCCLFHSATHPFWPSSTLKLSHHGHPQQNHYVVGSTFSRTSIHLPCSFQRAFSFSVWLDGRAHIIRERPGNWWNRPDSNWWPPDPKSGALPTALRLHIGGRWRCRSPRLSPRTVFKTGSEAARIHLPYWLEVLHHARSGVEPDRLGTRTPLHLQG